MSLTREYIERHGLFGPGDPIALAVSGGVDSMVMLHILRRLGYSLAVAHCNFGLRGADADADEALVRETARGQGVELLVKRFDTLGYAKRQRVSVQVAARDLRYRWFGELTAQGFSAVATAHHSNDVAETLLINLARGAGLKGLTGIKPKAQGIVRPLLWATRAQIEEYALTHDVAFRHDASNRDTKYSRNRIRHLVIPQLEKVNPAVCQRLNATALHLGQAWGIVADELHRFGEQVRTQAGGETRYCIKTLADYPHRALYLLEELAGYGFTPSQVEQVEQSLQAQPGKQYLSGGYRLIRDRAHLILLPLGGLGGMEVTIGAHTQAIERPVSLGFATASYTPTLALPPSSAGCALDWHALQFPLTLRPWRRGDWFIPLGMEGRKKISDYLTDAKVPRHAKEATLVLESNGAVAWVVGHRIDHRFRVQPTTQRVLMVRIRPMP